MKLNSPTNFCSLCLEVEPSDKRDDGLCDECGAISDKYNMNGEDQLNLESEEGWRLG